MSVRWRGRAVLAAGCALYATLALTSMRVKSSTFDECAHLPAGYTYLKLGDHRLNPEHPPLIKLLAAAPLLLLDPQVRWEDETWTLGRQWGFGNRFLYRWNDADRLLFWGRAPIVGLGCVLGAAVFGWARRHWGLPAAALALFLCVLSPDVLAHGQVVTTDLGITLFLFLAAFAFDRLTERATWPRLLLTGLAAGAAFATKFSAVVLGPMLVVLAGAVVLAPEPLRVDFGGWKPRAVAGRRGRLAWCALLLAAIALLALVVVWASYGFRPAPSPDPSLAFDWERVSPSDRRAAGDAGPHVQPRFPPPTWGGIGWGVDEVVQTLRRAGAVPEAYLFGFLRFFRDSAERPAFLMGEVSSRGWWYYFPVTFALKTPLALVALLALSVATRKAHAVPWRTECFLWLPVAIYLALTLSRNLNIGHRHLLPIYPFLFVAAGRSAAWAARSPRPASYLVAALLAWYAFAAARIHPHYLAYFNELGGGPARGYQYLVDSNLDWGQDLKGLKSYLDRNRISRVKLSYFGTADPAYYGIDGDLLPGYMLPPVRDVVREVNPGDVLAVSATNLQGVYLDAAARGLMERIRALTPLASVGYSILIYRADFSWSSPAAGPAPAPEE